MKRLYTTGYSVLFSCIEGFELVFSRTPAHTMILSCFHDAEWLAFLDINTTAGGIPEMQRFEKGLIRLH